MDNLHESRIRKIKSYIYETLELNNASSSDAMIALSTIIIVHTIDCGIDKHAFLESLSEAWDYYKYEADLQDVEPLNISSSYSI